MSSMQSDNGGAERGVGPTGRAAPFRGHTPAGRRRRSPKAFYERLGWRLDADFPLGEHDRIIQFTPPGSPASIQFGTGLTDMAPGSIEGLYLIVDDLDAAHKDLIGHGAQVSDIWHGRGLGKEGMEPGPDPGRSSCGAYMDARERGMSPDEAAEAAGRYMAEVKHVEAASA